jgi:Leucine-rich repeat (LRR) protein
MKTSAIKVLIIYAKMELKCEFKSVVYEGVEYYTCVVKKASITKAYTKIKNTIGEHLPGKSNQDVESIEFQDTTVRYFPRGLHKIFPALKVLRIDFCGLKSISRDDLIGLEKLEALDLRSNDLEWLPSNLLVRMTNLKRIVFFDSKLERISSKLLEPIASSLLVNFNSNTKINSYFSPGFGGSTKSLQELMKIIDKNCEKPDEREEMLSEIYDRQEFDRDFVVGFKDLWETKNFSDFSIVAESKVFEVHKCVLATQSSVFTTIFLNDMEEAHGEYAMDLFAIAAKYEVKNLKRITKILVLRNIDESNALEVFGLGYLYKSDDLKRCGFAVIQQMFPEEDLHDSMMEKPEELREIFEDGRKIQEIQEKMKSKLSKMKNSN